MNVRIDITNTVIKTDRLILRPWREDDLEDFYEYARVDGVGQFAGWKPHENIEESAAILAHFIEGKHIFAIEYQGKAVGSLGIQKYNEETFPRLDALRGREIGYVLAKNCWGQGLMTEAVKAVIAHLFDELKLDFITICHFDYNNRSRRVIEKCGFTKVGEESCQTSMGTLEKSFRYILYRDPKA
ncbi:MAG: GNAT family N-acetyltransferase [Clostridia bacterium]|nr:GNAT family N-acetyltransferase [Clostridia bacterium]